MFAPNFQRAFERIRPIYQPFLAIIGTSSIFTLMGLAATSRSTSVEQRQIALVWIFVLVAVNGLAMVYVKKHLRAYRFYLVMYVCSLMLPLSCVFPLLLLTKDQAGQSGFIFLILFVALVSPAYLRHYLKIIEYNSIQEMGMLRKMDSSEYLWRMNALQKLEQSSTNSIWFTFARYVAPFLPALGMAISRSLDQQGKSLFLAALFLIFFCLGSWGFLKYLILAIRLKQWEHLVSQVILLEE